MSTTIIYVVKNEREQKPLENVSCVWRDMEFGKELSDMTRYEINHDGNLYEITIPNKVLKLLVEWWKNHNK